MRDTATLQTPTDVAAYEFVILRVGEDPVFFRPKTPQLILGRDAKSDIPLNSPAISREHVKLRFEDGCWQIIDLGSANGTFLGDEAIRPKVLTVWKSALPLRLGPYTIKQHKAHETGKTPTLFLQPLSEISRGISHFVAVLDHENITLQPNQRKTAQLTVKNHGDDALRLKIIIRNMPSSWYELSHSELLLHPNTRMQILMRIELPDGTPPGIHPFEIDVQDSGNSAEKVTVYGMLDVTQQLFYGFSADLSHKNNRLYLNLTNVGNVDDTYKMSIQTPPNVSIVGHQWSSILKPEQRDTIQFGVQLRRPLIGTPSEQPITMIVRANSGIERKAETSLTTQPYLPLWAAGGVIGLILLLGIIGLLLSWF